MSRVLNNVDVPVSAETRRRVRHIAKEMGYQPTRTARALATDRTQSIALWSVNLRSAYYSDIIHYTPEEVIRHDYEMLIRAARLYDDLMIDTFRLLTWPADSSLIGDKPFINIGAYVRTDADSVPVDFKDQTAKWHRISLPVRSGDKHTMLQSWFGKHSSLPGFHCDN